LFWFRLLVTWISLRALISSLLTSGYFFAIYDQQRHGCNHPLRLERLCPFRILPLHNLRSCFQACWPVTQVQGSVGKKLGQRTRKVVEICPGTQRLAYVAVGSDNQPYQWRFTHILTTLFYEISVDDGVEQVIINWIIHVRVLIIVTPVKEKYMFMWIFFFSKSTDQRLG